VRDRYKRLNIPSFLSLECAGISVDAACSLGHGPLLLHASWHGEDVADDVTLTSQK